VNGLPFSSVKCWTPNTDLSILVTELLAKNGGRYWVTFLWPCVGDTGDVGGNLSHKRRFMSGDIKRFSPGGGAGFKAPFMQAAVLTIGYSTRDPVGSSAMAG
jgi:hypothetical protein